MRPNKIVTTAILLGCILVASTTLLADLDDENPPLPSAEPVPELPRPPDEKVTPTVPAKSKEEPKATTNPKATKKGQSSANAPLKKTRTTPTSKDGRKQPVTWTSKSLRATKEKGVMELSEDVVVTQADLKLKANNAKIFYDDKINEVNRVFVTGNVRITKASPDPSERISGQGNEGIFYNSERKVVLRGNAQLIRGEDVLRGKQITYELDSGWISVDNVEGVMQPGDKKP